MQGFAAVSILATLAIGAWPLAVFAEAPSGNTVVVGGRNSNAGGSQGSAGFGDSGIQAGASSNSNPNSAHESGGNSSSSTPPPCPPGERVVYRYNAQGQTQPQVYCMGPTSGGGLLPEIRGLAEQASDSQAWPTLSVNLNPGIGLTGLASYIWLGGGSPQMADATASADGLIVTVHATLTDVTWSYGDNSSGTDSGTDLGRPYPQLSSIQHTYQTDTYKRPDGYQVSAQLRFSVTYSVDGGPMQNLGIKAKTYSTSYRVEQIQPIAVATP